jgi:predicted methyltransferase
MGTSQIAAMLRATEPRRHSTPMRVNVLFGDDPDTLAAIKDAYVRGVGCKGIARALSDAGHQVSADSITRWLEAEGIK